jgi:adenine-specific DNA-methyltransferase
MIAQSFEESFDRVRQLVAKFRQGQQHYLSPSYNETEARQDFIDELWMALGWDVRHQSQSNPYEQDVKVERNVNVSGRGKRADYAFLAPNFRDVRFFVEAKKPSRNIDNRDDYFQTIRYGWHNQTPLAVLTDFEQFRVLDCRYKPDIATALDRAVKKFHFAEYEDPEKFREIYHLFSREAVLNGSLERFAGALPKVAGKATQRKLFGGGFQSIDESFLQDLDEYRAQLARSFKNRNPQLGGAELTEVTQRALDRLVFMRFLEDKLIEQQPLVENFGTRGTAWQDFIAESRRLDQIYNGIIFKKHDLLDSPDFKIDDRVFEEIRESLSHLNSSYDFNLIPIHILGSIYERFLGKTIVVTNKQARVEDKPEVRKAGGVYYTPEYIVRYIVENTVGKLIAGKTPEQVAEMRFADISCGSGSFLLGVYDLLLRHHTAYYNRNKTNREKGAKAGCLKRDDGTLQLSLRQKQAILVNNIYGVDIDQQAVEVAQLSLYLKLLEEETTATSRAYQLEFGQRLLPSLGQNIVSGNSLIGWDILDGKLFDREEEHKLNPMDFKDKFKEVMKRGGFDAIVGNPPYIRMEVFKEIKDYLRAKYKSHDERSDLYVYMIERGHNLLKATGRLGMIISNKFLRANYGKPVRSYLSRNTKIERIVDFAGLPVFAGATVRTIVLITSRALGESPMLYSPPPSAEKFHEIASGLTTIEEAIKEISYEVTPASLGQPVWSFAKRDSEDLLMKIQMHNQSLREYCGGLIGRGIVSGLTEAFTIDAQRRDEILLDNPKADEIIKPFLNGRDVRRYNIECKNIYLIYTYHGINIRDYPAVEQHLKPFRGKLKERATKQAWYELQQPQYRFSQYMDSPKIIFPDIATTPRFALDTLGFYGSNTTYFLPTPDKYLLGLLNSRLGHFYFSKTCAGLEGKNEIYLRFFGQYLEGFSVRTINFSDPEDKARHDRMVQLVDQMLAAKQQLAQSRTDRDKAFYESKCAALDRQIDQLVYELYQLTDDEIAIVEAAG